MRKSIILVVLWTIGYCSFAQQTIYDTIVHDSLDRSFILYVPADYDGGTEVPLVFNFHGYTSNAYDQMIYGDFRGIADTAGFIIAHPQGEKDLNGITHWNVGWNTSNVDDIGFISTLLDTLIERYNIDTNKVYATGMSNGGYLSFTIACDLSERFAAIASVTGAMVPVGMSTCNVSHPTGILQFHGTSDLTVPYNGSSTSSSISDILDYWQSYNNCDTLVEVDIPDVNTSDGSVVKHLIYPRGDDCVNVEHYKIIGGGHTWPGSAVNLSGTNYDIDASAIIWEFFRIHNMNGRTTCDTFAGVEEVHCEINNRIKLYPNPAKDFIFIEMEFGSLPFLEYKIMDFAGKIVLTGQYNRLGGIEIAGLDRGIYNLQIIGEQKVLEIPFVKMD